jgi:dTDP-glucose pyrophosphorylase
VSAANGAHVVGVIPAAGHARRLRLAAGSKEMLPIGDRPVISYLVERLSAGVPAGIRLVTRPEKSDLVAWAREHGLDVVFSAPPNVCASVLDGSQDLDDDAIVLTGFPDTVWEAKDAFAKLRSAVLDGHRIALGLFETTEPERCDIVDVGPDGTVRSIVVKPTRPSATLTWGCLAARVGALRPMRPWTEPGDYMNTVCSTGDVVGIRLPGRYLDIGTPEALAAVTAEIDR